MVKSTLDSSNLANDILATDRLSSNTGQVVGSLVDLALFNEEAGRLVLEEAENEDDSRHHDVKTGGNHPLVMGIFGQVDMAAVVGEVSQDDTDVDSASEAASGETSNRSGSDLGDIDWSVKRGVS